MWGSGWAIIGWLVGLELGCNDSNRLGLGYRKVVRLLLAILMELGMTCTCRFLLSYAEVLVCKNEYSFGNNFINIHPKIRQLQNQHNWFITCNIWRKFSWCNTWKSTGMNTHSYWWTATRVITWATTKNVIIFLAWNYWNISGLFRWILWCL